MQLWASAHPMTPVPGMSLRLARAVVSPPPGCGFGTSPTWGGSQEHPKLSAVGTAKGPEAPSGAGGMERGTPRLHVAGPALQARPSQSSGAPAAGAVGSAPTWNCAMAWGLGANRPAQPDDAPLPPGCAILPWTVGFHRLRRR